MALLLHHIQILTRRVSFFLPPVDAILRAVRPRVCRRITDARALPHSKNTQGARARPSGNIRFTEKQVLEIAAGREQKRRWDIGQVDKEVSCPSNADVATTEPIQY